MKTGVTELYPNEQVSQRVTEYSAAHSTALPQYIVEFHDWASKNLEWSIYLTSNFQSQCHILLARMISAKRGTFLWFSPNFRD